jgi:hypothetical protein
VSTERSIHDSPVADRNGQRPAATAQTDLQRDQSHGGALPRTVGWFGRCFYACGGKGLPPQIACRGGQYVLEKVLKHDFHAATGLYTRQESEAVGWTLAHADYPPNAQRAAWAKAHSTELPTRLICKINRRMHFCFLPLGLIGRLMTRSEVSKLRRCEGIPEVPQVLARIDSHMYVYEYIEGQSLNEKPPLPADFFDRLLVVMQQVHARNLVHFDLHKPGNILVDTEGRPHIIDFQISRHIGDRFLLSRRLSSRLRRWLQSYDLYHIYKHKRRLQPQLLTEAETKLSYNHTLGLEIQRAIARPYKKIRRACLRYLYAKGILAGTQDAGTCVETNPVRWTKGHDDEQHRAKNE